LSTTSASKSALVRVKTESSQRSTSGSQPCTTVSAVTARATALDAAGGALIAWSSLPEALSTTSQPASRRRCRIASAAGKSRARRSWTRSSASL
jgi:hypothetical protein